MSKITKKQIQEIVELRNQGLKLKEIAERYPVSLQAIGNILRNQKKDELNGIFLNYDFTEKELVEIFINLMSRIK
jgi:predicted DNA-binding protein YlxM (UPF0122 family)